MRTISIVTQMRSTSLTSSIKTESLWPHEPIVDTIVVMTIRDVGNGDVHVGKACPACNAPLNVSKTMTLWERFAQSEPCDYVSIVVVLDLRRFDEPIGDELLAEERFNEDLHSDEEIVVGAPAPEKRAAPPSAPKPNMVRLIGNFTNWRRPIAMTEMPDMPDLYSTQIKVPPGAPLLFRFQIDQRWVRPRPQWSFIKFGGMQVVSDAHPIMIDSRGQRLNAIVAYFKICPASSMTPSD